MSAHIERKPVRIGIDGFNLAMSRGTGVATYARVLSRCLTDMGHPVDVLYGLPMSSKASAIMSEVAFFDRLEQGPSRAPKPVISSRWWAELRHGWQGCDAAVVPMTGWVDRRGFRMPAFDRILNISDLFQLAGRHFRRSKRFLRVRIPSPPDIMHWTYPLPIVLEGSRNIYTIHDLVPLRLPQTTLDDKGYHLSLMRGCAAEGAAICTVSEASRSDIATLLPEAAAKVMNTYQAIDDSTDDVQDETELRDFLRGVFGLEPQGYFLFFGSLEPKKNIGRLIEGYLSAGTSRPLVVVGAQAWKSEGELHLLKYREHALPGGPQIRQMEYLPFGTLRRLIRGARAVLLPSLHEGFGLPILEAMARGVPTLASNEASLPEIAGEGSLLVDAYDVQAISRGIRQLDTDDALRRRLAEHGPLQAARFSQDEYALRLAALYERVLEKRKQELLF
jgi:glycosyltransferase involved in cell wall biosynthesis